MIIKCTNCSAKYNVPDINISNSTKCWSYVKKDNKILQTNPQKKSYTQPLFMGKEEETREYFQPVQGKVNAYYTQENLVSYTQFVLGINCVSDDGTEVTGETCITPTYEELKHVKTRAVWFKDNTDMMVVLGIVGIILLAFIFSVLKKTRKGVFGR